MHQCKLKWIFSKISIIFIKNIMNLASYLIETKHPSQNWLLFSRNNYVYIDNLANINNYVITFASISIVHIFFIYKI